MLPGAGVCRRDVALCCTYSWCFFSSFCDRILIASLDSSRWFRKVPRMPPTSRYHLVPKFDSTNVGLRAPEIYVFQGCVNQTPEIQRNPTRNHRRIACIRQKTCLGFHYVFDVFFLWSCEISVSTIRLVISVEHNGSKMGHCWPSKLLNLVQFSYKTWWQNHFESSYSGPVVPKEMPKKGPGVVNVRWWPIFPGLKNFSYHFLSTLGLRCPVSL